MGRGTRAFRCPGERSFACRGHDTAVSNLDQSASRPRGGAVRNQATHPSWTSNDRRRRNCGDDGLSAFAHTERSHNWTAYRRRRRLHPLGSRFDLTGTVSVALPLIAINPLYRVTASVDHYGSDFSAELCRIRRFVFAQSPQDGHPRLQHIAFRHRTDYPFRRISDYVERTQGVVLCKLYPQRLFGTHLLGSHNGRLKHENLDENIGEVANYFLLVCQFGSEPLRCCSSAEEPELFRICEKCVLICQRTIKRRSRRRSAHHFIHHFLNRR